MSNTLTSALMGDPVRTPKPETAKPAEPAAAVRWFRPGTQKMSITVNKKGEILLSGPMRALMFADGAPGFVRVGQLESGELVIERTDEKNPMARKVFASNGVVGGGSLQHELDASGFVPGRYPARLNQQATIALVKKP